MRLQAFLVAAVLALAASPAAAASRPDLVVDAVTVKSGPAASFTVKVIVRNRGQAVGSAPPHRGLVEEEREH